MHRIVICGVGALGSHAGMFLRNADAAIRVIDFDEVEKKNTGSQFHTKTAVGKKKVESFRGTILLYWGLRIETIPRRITSDNVATLLDGATLILDCFDNGPSRRVIQNYIRTLDKPIPCLHGALAADGMFGRVIWDEHYVVEDGEPGAPTCEDNQVLPFIAITSAYMAHAAQIFLKTGTKVGFQVSPGGAIRV